MELRELAEQNEAALLEGWQDELDDVYREWKRWTNISASQLRA